MPDKTTTAKQSVEQKSPSSLLIVKQQRTINSSKQSLATPQPLSSSTSTSLSPRQPNESSCYGHQQSHQRRRRFYHVRYSKSKQSGSSHQLNGTANSNQNNDLSNAHSDQSAIKISLSNLKDPAVLQSEKPDQQNDRAVRTRFKKLNPQHSSPDESLSFKISKEKECSSTSSDYNQMGSDRSYHRNSSLIDNSNVNSEELHFLTCGVCIPSITPVQYVKEPDESGMINNVISKGKVSTASLCSTCPSHAPLCRTDEQIITSQPLLSETASSSHHTSNFINFISESNCILSNQYSYSGLTSGSQVNVNYDVINDHIFLDTTRSKEPSNPEPNYNCGPPPILTYDNSILRCSNLDKIQPESSKCVNLNTKQVNEIRENARSGTASESIRTSSSTSQMREKQRPQMQHANDIKKTNPISLEFNAWTDNFIRNIGPNKESEKLRRKIFNYLRKLILQTLRPNVVNDRRHTDIKQHIQDQTWNSRSISNLTVMRYGSLPLMTYLPDGDIDLVIVTFDENGVLEEDSTTDSCLATLAHRFKQTDIMIHSKFPIVKPTLIEAEVRVLKFSIRNVAIDLSVNKVGGTCSFVMLDLFDRCLCRQSHLFKRSILLIKAWCAYESRTLGSRHGLMATYALEILVMCLLVTGGKDPPKSQNVSLINNMRSITDFSPQLTTPLDVLREFLHYYSTFEWDKFAVTACGPIPLCWLRESAYERHQRRSVSQQALSTYRISDDLVPTGITKNGLLTSQDLGPRGLQSEASFHPNNVHNCSKEWSEIHKEKRSRLSLQYHDPRCSSLILKCSCLECTAIDPQFERQAVELFNTTRHLPVPSTTPQPKRRSKLDSESIPPRLFPSATADFLEDCRRYFSKCFGPVNSSNHNTSRTPLTRVVTTDGNFRDARTRYISKNYPNRVIEAGPLHLNSQVQQKGYCDQLYHYTTDTHKDSERTHDDLERPKLSEASRTVEVHRNLAAILLCPCGQRLLPHGIRPARSCVVSHSAIRHVREIDNHRIDQSHYKMSEYPIPFNSKLHSSSSPQFPIRTMNVVDPLQPFNNLGRSVSTGNFYRIMESFKRSFRILELVIATNEQYALEFFFKNSLRIIDAPDPPISVLPLPCIWFSAIPSDALENLPPWLTGMQSASQAPFTAQSIHSSEPRKDELPCSELLLIQQQSQAAPVANTYSEGSLRNLLQKVRSKGAADSSYVYPKIHRSFEESIALLMAGVLADLRKRKGLSNRLRRNSFSITEVDARSLKLYSKHYFKAAGTITEGLRRIPLFHQSLVTTSSPNKGSPNKGFNARLSVSRSISLPVTVERYIERRVVYRSYQRGLFPSCADVSGNTISKPIVVSGGEKAIKELPSSNIPTIKFKAINKERWSGKCCMLPEETKSNMVINVEVPGLSTREIEKKEKSKSKLSMEDEHCSQEEVNIGSSGRTKVTVPCNISAIAASPSLPSAMSLKPLRDVSTFLRLKDGDKCSSFYKEDPSVGGVTTQHSANYGVFESDPTEVAVIMSLCSVLCHPFFSAPPLPLSIAQQMRQCPRCVGHRCLPQCQLQHLPKQRSYHTSGAGIISPDFQEAEFEQDIHHHQQPSHKLIYPNSTFSHFVPPHSNWVPGIRNQVVDMCHPPISCQQDFPPLSLEDPNCRQTALPPEAQHSIVDREVIPTHPYISWREPIPFSNSQNRAYNTTTVEGVPLRTKKSIMQRLSQPLSNSLHAVCNSNPPNHSLQNSSLNVYQNQHVDVDDNIGRSSSDTSMSSDGHFSRGKRSEFAARTMVSASMLANSPISIQLSDANERNIAQRPPLIQDGVPKPHLEQTAHGIASNANNTLQSEKSGNRVVVGWGGQFRLVFRPILDGRLDLLRRYMNLICGKEAPNAVLRPPDFVSRFRRKIQRVRTTLMNPEIHSSDYRTDLITRFFRPPVRLTPGEASVITPADRLVQISKKIASGTISARVSSHEQSSVNTCFPNITPVPDTLIDSNASNQPISTQSMVNSPQTYSNFSSNHRNSTTELAEFRGSSRASLGIKEVVYRKGVKTPVQQPLNICDNNTPSVPPQHNTNYIIPPDVMALQMHGEFADRKKPNGLSPINCTSVSSHVSACLRMENGFNIPLFNRAATRWETMDKKQSLSSLTMTPKTSFQSLEPPEVPLKQLPSVAEWIEFRNRLAQMKNDPNLQMQLETLGLAPPQAFDKTSLSEQINLIRRAHIALNKLKSQRLAEEPSATATVTSNMPSMSNFETRNLRDPGYRHSRDHQEHKRQKHRKTCSEQNYQYSNHPQHYGPLPATSNKTPMDRDDAIHTPKVTSDAVEHQRAITHSQCTVSAEPLLRQKSMVGGSLEGESNELNDGERFTVYHPMPSEAFDYTLVGGAMASNPPLLAARVEGIPIIVPSHLIVNSALLASKYPGLLNFCKLLIRSEKQERRGFMKIQSNSATPKMSPTTVTARSPSLSCRPPPWPPSSIDPTVGFTSNSPTSQPDSISSCEPHQSFQEDCLMTSNESIDVSIQPPRPLRSSNPAMLYQLQSEVVKTPAPPHSNGVPILYPSRSFRRDTFHRFWEQTPPQFNRQAKLQRRFPTPHQSERLLPTSDPKLPVTPPPIPPPSLPVPRPYGINLSISNMTPPSVKSCLCVPPTSIPPSLQNNRKITIDQIDNCYRPSLPPLYDMNVERNSSFQARSPTLAPTQYSSIELEAISSPIATQLDLKPQSTSDIYRGPLEPTSQDVELSAKPLNDWMLSEPHNLPTPSERTVSQLFSMPVDMTQHNLEHPIVPSSLSPGLHVNSSYALSLVPPPASQSNKHTNREELVETDITESSLTKKDLNIQNGFNASENKHNESPRIGKLWTMLTSSNSQVSLFIESSNAAALPANVSSRTTVQRRPTSSSLATNKNHNSVASNVIRDVPEDALFSLVSTTPTIVSPTPMNDRSEAAISISKQINSLVSIEPYCINENALSVSNLNRQPSISITPQKRVGSDDAKEIDDQTENNISGNKTIEARKTAKQVVSGQHFTYDEFMRLHSASPASFCPPSSSYQHPLNNYNHFTTNTELNIQRSSYRRPFHQNSSRTFQFNENRRRSQNRYCPHSNHSFRFRRYSTQMSRSSHFNEFNTSRHIYPLFSTTSILKGTR